MKGETSLGFYDQDQLPSIQASSDYCAPPDACEVSQKNKTNVFFISQTQEGPPIAPCARVTKIFAISSRSQ